MYASTPFSQKGHVGEKCYLPGGIPCMPGWGGSYNRLQFTNSLFINNNNFVFPSMGFTNFNSLDTCISGLSFMTNGLGLWFSNWTPGFSINTFASGFNLFVDNFSAWVRASAALSSIQFNSAVSCLLLLTHAYTCYFSY